jgi:hypothetical protein
MIGVVGFAMLVALPFIGIEVFERMFKNKRKCHQKKKQAKSYKVLQMPLLNGVVG